MSYELGSHPAQSRSAVLGVTDNGNDQIAVEYEFTDGPNKGKRITAYLYFTEKTTDRSIESLRYSGFQGDDLSDLSSLSRPDVPTVQLVIDTEEYNGETQTRVKWINRLGGPAVKKPMDAAQTKDFASRMKAHLVAFDKSNGAKPSAAPKKHGNGAAGRPAPEDRPDGRDGMPPDDSIPF